VAPREKDRAQDVGGIRTHAHDVSCLDGDVRARADGDADLASVGASFTPSPIIATNSPLLRRFTYSAFMAGPAGAG